MRCSCEYDERLQCVRRRHHPGACVAFLSRPQDVVRGIDSFAIVFYPAYNRQRLEFHYEMNGARIAESADAFYLTGVGVTPP